MRPSACPFVVLLQLLDLPTDRQSLPAAGVFTLSDRPLHPRLPESLMAALAPGRVTSCLEGREAADGESPFLQMDSVFR